jgi:hypothetical protein
MVEQVRSFSPGDYDKLTFVSCGRSRVRLLVLLWKSVVTAYWEGKLKLKGLRELGQISLIMSMWVIGISGSHQYPLISP